MAGKRKLPKGLAEFEASLCDLNYTEDLLKRLCDLPEANFTSEIAAFRDAMKVVQETEMAAVAARKAARRIAERAWQAAKEAWTIKELQEATGYDQED